MANGTSRAPEAEGVLWPPEAGRHQEGRRQAHAALPCGPRTGGRCRGPRSWPLVPGVQPRRHPLPPREGPSVPAWTSKSDLEIFDVHSGHVYVALFISKLAFDR